MYDNSACSVADGCTRRPTREATASAVPWHCPCACMKFGIHVVLSVKVDVSWLSAFKMNTIEISRSVKGYHYFKVKPNPGEVMQVHREYNNPVDPNAMSVLREGGKQVGRVPANLCGAFRQLLEIGYTRKIICIYTGLIGHCQNPHVHHVITDKVRYTRNTDFVYNGQKTLVPTGTLYARFTVPHSQLHCMFVLVFCALNT